MQGTILGPMLQLFRSDEPSYQPVHPSVPLAMENGDPQVSLENLKRLGLVVQDIWVRKGLSRVLLAFNTGEQYLAPRPRQGRRFSFYRVRGRLRQLRGTAIVLRLPAAGLRRQITCRVGASHPTGAQQSRPSGFSPRRDRTRGELTPPPSLLWFGGVVTHFAAFGHQQSPARRIDTSIWQARGSVYGIRRLAGLLVTHSGIW